ncbi:MAG: ROK family protein [Gammaproteobacteria bacterium]|nr:ROK family protein [Gammaproteobacteria bacterium]
MRIGIDLGGTKIEVLVLDDDGKELHRERINTPQGNYIATLDCICELITSTEKKLCGIGSIGICTPGSISPANSLLRNSNSICLNNQPFKQDLENKLNRKIRIANDANCFALSEATDGAAKDAEIVFGVIIGTGCGAGIVINKKIIDGPNAISGEWGHNPLPYPEGDELKSTQCWCGKNDCIETFLSGSGFTNDYQLSTGLKKSSEQIIIDANDNDSFALEVLSRYQLRMAKSLSQVINILDPHVIVLGGGMSNIDCLYSTIPKLWQQYVFSDTVRTKLVAPVHGDSSGVRGAAWLWD